MQRTEVDNDIDLKVLAVKDAEELFALTDSCRNYLREWLPWLDFTKTVENTKNFIEATQNQLKSNNGFQTGIWYRNQLVGVVGHLIINQLNRYASLGYWLGKDFQEKGIMTKACRALVEYSFNELNMHRVEIRCAVENFKSRAITERLRLHNEGTLREVEWIYDHYVSHVVYGILKREWGNSTIFEPRREQN